MTDRPRRGREVLTVCAWSETEGIRVDWTAHATGDELAMACVALERFLSRFPREWAAGAVGAHIVELPAAHPHRDESPIRPPNAGDLRFIRLIVGTREFSPGFVEPSATDRALGSVVTPGPAPRTPEHFAIVAFSAGDRHDLRGPIVSADALAEAIRGEIERRLT